MEPDSILTSVELRAGRAVANVSAPELARRSKVSLSTIQRWELGKGSPTTNNARAVREALEAAGVEFVDGGAKLKVVEK
jgi:DNA-binding transcriptional regulator YiaG